MKRHHLIPLMAVGVVGLLAFADQLAGEQPGAAPPPGNQRPTFVPHAGYKRTVQKQNIERDLLARGVLAAPAAPRPTWGERRVPVILVAFSNLSGPIPPTEYVKLLFGTENNAGGPLETLRQYFRDVSNGNLDVTGEVVPWFSLPNTDGYYENNNNGNGPPFGELLRLSLDNADQFIDFSQFDTDGPDGLPNSGDDDGTVDTVWFIHAEAGAELNIPAVAGNIWSHSWHYSEPSYGNGGRYKTKDIRRDTDGNPKIGQNGEPENILVEDYTIQPGIAQPTEPGQSAQIGTIGVICHEYCHALGLPDLYDRTPRNADSSGIGTWCLMASGSYGGDGAHSERPAHLGAWAKWYLGWATVLPLVSSGQLVFEPVQERGQIYRFDVPGTDEQEYFLIEFRDGAWNQPGHINWDAYLHASGLAIWHVDERVGRTLPDGQPNEGWPFADPDKGQNDAPSRAGAISHSLVALVQSDRQFDLEHKRNIGDLGDVWASGQTFGDDPTVGSRGYDGSLTGFGLRGIGLGTRTAMIEIAPPPPPGEVLVHRVPAAPPPRDSSPPMSERRKLSPTVPEEKSADCKTVERVQAKIKSGRGRDPGHLPDEEAKKIASIDRSVIKQASSGVQRQVLMEAAAKQRQTVIAPQGQPANDAQRATLEVMGSVRQETPVTVQTDPSGKFVERLTKLKIPIKNKASLISDAKDRVANELRPLFGRADLKAVEQAGRPADTVRFEQVIDVDGEKLPIFGKFADLHYDKGKEVLAAVTSELATPASITVTGKGQLNPTEACRIAAKYLRISSSEKLKERCERGVYLVGDDPAKARVASRVRVPAGPGQKDIEIYLDAETKQVLDVK